MGIFDEDESIVLKKGIQSAKIRQRLSKTPYTLESVSDDDRRLLEYANQTDRDKVTELASGLGTGAIQKVGNGVVYGKFAKAVRKYLASKRAFADPSDIIGVARINNGERTIQSVIRDMGVKTKFPYDNALKSRQLASGSHGYTSNAPNMQYSKNYNHVRDVVVRSDIAPYNSTMHELGHIVDYSKDISPGLKLFDGVPQYYHEAPSEIFAEAFSKVNKYPTTNPALGANADKALLNDDLVNLIRSYKVNIYPK